jgi:hypothetical protein
MPKIRITFILNVISNTLSMMDQIIAYIIITVLGVTIGILFKKFNRKTLREFYFIFSLGLASISLSIVVLLSLLYHLSINLTIGYSILLLLLSIFITIYVYSYRKIFRNNNVFIFLLSLFVISSIFSSFIYNNSIYYQNSDNIINQPISTDSLFIDYGNVLINSSMPKPDAILGSNLDSYENITYSYIMQFINEIYNLNTFSNKLLASISKGNITESKILYSEILNIYSNLNNIYTKINFYSSYLSQYSDYRSYNYFTSILQSNMTQVNSLVKNEEYIMNILDKAPITSHIPDSIKIYAPSKIPFNSSVTIYGHIEPLYLTNNISGNIIIKYLNITKIINVSNGSFSFNLYINRYITNIKLTLIYSGNNELLPSLATKNIPINITPTFINVKILNQPYVGSTLKINGNVTGSHREIVVSLLNYSHTYVVNSSFTINFPLPLYLTNSTYQVNITVLPDGSYSPSFISLYFIPKLYPLHILVNVPKIWIDPKSIIISGKVWSTNNSINSSFNNIKIFIFVGNSRYETITHNGYFSIEIKPKITLFYGNQVIFAEADPTYGFYRVVAKASTLLYNPLLYSILAIIMILTIFLIIKYRKREKSKIYNIVEVPIWRR